MKKLLIASFLALLPLLGSAMSTDSLIYKMLIGKGYTARHATFWVKVSKAETANYTSALCRYHNNLWGMSYFKSGKRPTHAAYRAYYNGKPTRFAGYKTKEDAIKELLYYLEYAKYPKDFKDLHSFVSFMKSKGYFEEPFNYYYSILRSI
jgi:hypothetical protein